MARMSKSEKEFRAKYPNARVVIEPSKVCIGMSRYTVYAGDYLCSSSLTRSTAFYVASLDAANGSITPDPNELATTESHPA